MAMHTFNVGDILAAADVTEYLENSHFAYKASGTSLTSHPALSNDPDLVLAVDANKIYEFWLEMPYLSSAVGIGVNLAIPSGATLGGTISGRSGGSFAGTDLSVAFALGQYDFDLSNTSDYYCVSVHGQINTASASGNLQVQWCQASSNATSSTVRTGAMLSMRRVA